MAATKEASSRPLLGARRRDWAIQSCSFRDDRQPLLQYVRGSRSMDIVYDIRGDMEETFAIGDSPVSVNKNSYVTAGGYYGGTDRLWELLTKTLRRYDT